MILSLLSQSVNGKHTIYSYSVIIWSFVTLCWNSSAVFMMTDKFEEDAYIKICMKVNKSTTDSQNASSSFWQIFSILTISYWVALVFQSQTYVSSRWYMIKATNNQQNTRKYEKKSLTHSCRLLTNNPSVHLHEWNSLWNLPRLETFP